MTRLHNKVALITGAGRGIGKAIALRFADEGAHVAVLDRDDEVVNVVAQITPPRPLAIALTQTDVSDPAPVQRAVEQVIQRFGRIDILVNNAGIAGGNGDFLDIGYELWQRIIGVNLTGMFLCGQTVAKRMLQAGIPGRIINIGSINSFAAEKGAAAYVVAKHGVLGLTRAMAVDLASHRITVNCIAPGPILVDRNAELFNGALKEQLQRRVPLGSAGTGDDIASAAVFLASDESSFITGATLSVDGGVLAYLNFD